MSARDDVRGWRRITGPAPCPLCASLADGQVLPAYVRVAAHPSCACQALPVFQGVPDRHRPPVTDELEEVTNA